MGLAKQTHAIVVAIESYPALGAAWALPGLAVQAADFARWLTETRGVPAANVQVFLSGGDRAAFTQLGIPAGQIGSATAAEIERFLAALPEVWPNGELLFVYWAGHGFVARDGGRRLILGDAAPNLKKNLDLVQAMELLRSDRAGSFTRQIGIVDACARFFEELQASTDLPPGGLPRAQQRAGVRQFFYLAASSGEYATNNSFGPQVLKLLQELPREEWPPKERLLRDRILDAFSAMQSAREADQQPAWLEYTDGLDSKSTMGVPPTLPDIHSLALRARLPLSQLRLLAQLGAKCPVLGTAEGRDRLCEEVEGEVPLANRAHSRETAGLDLMRIIAGALEQGRREQLVAAVVRLESNSDESFLFGQAARHIETIQGLWPRLQAMRMPLKRARALYEAARPARMEETEAGSLEEIVDRLVDAGEPLSEFLLRTARERQGEPAHDEMEAWVTGKAEWASALARAEVRMKKEVSGRTYLMLEVGRVDGEFRVVCGWLWPAGAEAAKKMRQMEGPGDLAGDIAELMDEAEGEGGNVYLEILAPEELLHLDRGRLALTLRGRTMDPEHSHPVALRWVDRMGASIRDRDYMPGRWRNAASRIRERLQTAQRAYWLGANDDPDEFRVRYLNGEAGELIGIPLSSHSDARRQIIELIVSGGLPFACWLRCGDVDVEDARRSVKDLIDECAFDEVSYGMLRHRVRCMKPLGDVLLLWDDPQRNPYDYKYSDVAQKG